MRESHQALSWSHHLCARAPGPRSFLIHSCAVAVDVRQAAAANKLIHMGTPGARCTGTHVALGYYASGELPFGRGRFSSESARGNAANPYASLRCVPLAVFFCLIQTRPVINALE